MTPKQKAIELFDKYCLVNAEAVELESGELDMVFSLSDSDAKKCALIAVDFAKEFITGDVNESFDKALYIFEVKEEIEKL